MTEKINNIEKHLMENRQDKNARCPCVCASRISHMAWYPYRTVPCCAAWNGRPPGHSSMSDIRCWVLS